MDATSKIPANRYVIITPARDEAQHIEETIKSVLAQTVKPVEWVIVDDGSTDATGEIIDRFAAQHSWISLVRRPRVGPRVNATAVMEAFYHGYESLKTKDWEFIVKLDADLSFEPAYFESCFKEFRNDPKLGVGGGLIWSAENGIA